MKTNDKKSVEIKKGRRYYLVEHCANSSLPGIVKVKVTEINSLTSVGGKRFVGPGVACDRFVLNDRIKQDGSKIYSNKREAINNFKRRLRKYIQQANKNIEEAQKELNNLPGR